MNRVTAKLVRDRMDQGREDAAKKLFAWEQVRDAIGEAAGRGLGQTVFAPPPGVGLRETLTAVELVQRLNGKGFRTEWRTRRDPGDVLTHELVVSWEATPVGGR